MKRLLVFVLAIVLFGSCSSKKILSVRKIAHNGVLNNIASQYDLSQKQYSTLNNSAKNLSDVEASITPVSYNQDFLASKNKIEPSVLTTNYSLKELPPITEYEKINNSFLEKFPILKHKETPNKDSVEIITKSGRIYRGVVVNSDYDGYFIKLSTDREIYLSNIEIKSLTVISSTPNIKSNEIPTTGAPSQDYLEEDSAEEQPYSDESTYVEKKNKILWIIVSVVLFAATSFMTLISLIFLAFGLPIDAVIFLLISTILGYLSFRSSKKAKEIKNKTIIQDNDSNANKGEFSKINIKPNIGDVVYFEDYYNPGSKIQGKISGVSNSSWVTLEYLDKKGRTKTKNIVFNLLFKKN